MKKNINPVYKPTLHIHTAVISVKHLQGDMEQ